MKDTQKIELNLKLFPHHLSIVQDIIKNKKRYNVICSSRQYCKSTICIELMIYWMLSNPDQKGLYITPQYPLSREAFKIMVAKLGSNLIKDANKSELKIDFINGSTLLFKSSTNEEAIRGLQAHYIVVDEFSFIQDGIFESVIRPCGNVIGKQFLIVSTPKGKNLFYTMWMRGKNKDDPNYLSFKAHYTNNPAYNLTEVEDAKKTLPDLIFKQEYEGEFLDDGGSVFPDYSHILQEKFAEGKFFSMGLDLGRRSDHAVLYVLNEIGETVFIMRENKKNWNLIVGIIIQFLNKYKGKCLIEVNGIGDVLYEDIHNKYKNVEPFLTTNDTKNMIIEELILSINDASIKIPNEKLYPVLHDEMGTFSFTYSHKARKIYYGAKLGFHDDVIIAMALANHCRKHSVSKFKILGKMRKG